VVWTFSAPPLPYLLANGETGKTSGLYGHLWLKIGLELETLKQPKIHSWLKALLEWWVGATSSEATAFQSATVSCDSWQQQWTFSTDDIRFISYRYRISYHRALLFWRWKQSTGCPSTELVEKK